jgi:thiol-disulfide isomerase/thioredoxin
VIEVQAVRRTLPLLLALLLATAVGCKTSDRFGRGALGKNDSKDGNPFTGSRPAGAAAADSSGDPASLASGGSTSKRSGVLAGSIIDGDARLRPNARIQIIDIDALPTSGIAPLTATSNSEGYFDISGLDPGRTYRLIARVQEGRRLLVGSARVVPPNPRVRIYLTDELPAGENTGVPAKTGVPVPARSVTPGGGGPAATIGTPINNPEEGVTTPLAGDNPMPPAVNTTDPALIAKDKDKKVQDGFTREPVPANVPGPGRGDTREKPMTPSNTLPAPPSSVGDPPEPMSSLIPGGRGGDTDRGAVIAPDTPTVVPSCVRVGTQIDNFALYDRQGKVYEFKKQRTGKLVLLDFWFTECPPCRAAMSHLNDLQAKYGKHGLEIIGVTYEPGETIAEKQQNLNEGLRRYNLNPRYPLVFGGGGKGDCPVAKRLEVNRFPTLVLLDETGKIIWRSEGLDHKQANELAWKIYQKLVAQKKLAMR